MKRLYQAQWHGIDFASFAPMRDDRLADGGFYAAFYEAFFRKHHRWEDLDSAWLDAKADVAALALRRAPPSADRVLSVGCGIGAVERHLVSRFPALEVTETSEVPLRWLRPMLAPGAVHLGEFPACLPPGRVYHIILLSAVDYCFDQAGLDALLRSVRAHLVPGGRALLVSASYDAGGLLRELRHAARRVLEAAGLRRRGQWWGWLRTRGEYRRAMAGSGLAISGEGHLREGSYWIEGEHA